ncbi:MAG: STAS domain-containing protein [Chitinispirillia bacterium]|jgi:anti-anti-sigma factor
MLKIKRGVVEGKDSIEIFDAFSFFDQKLEEIINELIDRGDKELVFNCKHLSYITSAGIGQIFKIIKRFKAIGGQLYICNMSEDIKEYFQDISIDKYFTFF